MFFIITFGLIACLVPSNTGQLYRGSSCIVERSKATGVCERSYDCPAVLDDLKNGRRYTRCGFERRIEIVCCPVPVRPTTTTVAPKNDANLRISERKCNEYSQYVYEYINAVTLSLGDQSKRIRVDKCGHKVIPLIVGGEFAKPREFPHMALVGYDDGSGNPTWQCGGTLISELFIVTAGHCLFSRIHGEAKFIRLGDLNILKTDDDARPENYNVIEVIKHPSYKTSSKYNDIGLLKLDRQVKLDPYKRPACLSNSFEVKESKCIATGWGHTQWSGESSSHLQKVVLDKFTHAECNESYLYEISSQLRNGITPSTQFCAGSRNESRDTCQGDSGGPLQVFYPNLYCMYKLIGVTSFGITCGNIGIPGVYTLVYPYLDWIERIVWGNDTN